MTTNRYTTQADLEAAIFAKLTAVQTAKVHMLQAAGWSLYKSVEHEGSGTGAFLTHPDGRHTLVPPTADARCITAAKSGTIRYNPTTWERM